MEIESMKAQFGNKLATALPVRPQRDYNATRCDIAASSFRSVVLQRQSRRAVLARLQRESLMDRNKRHSLPDVPVRIGPVSSSQAEGMADFVRVLQDSGFAFTVIHFDVRVQGREMEASVCEALRYFAQETAKHNLQAHKSSDGLEIKLDSRTASWTSNRVHGDYFSDVRCGGES